MSTPLLRIGEVAVQAGVSTRTLRYYEELGLLSPSAYSPGGSRRYGDAELARVQRIRELQRMMGFDLDQIGEILRAEDRLDELRSVYRAGPATGRQRDVILEAIAINDSLRTQVRDKITAVEGFLRELDAAAVRYRNAAAERGITNLSTGAGGRSGPRGRLTPATRPRARARTDVKETPPTASRGDPASDRHKIGDRR
jgi:DNA-binding transcriptional MerR regulator